MDLNKCVMQLAATTPHRGLGSRPRRGHQLSAHLHGLAAPQTGADPGPAPSPHHRARDGLPLRAVIGCSGRRCGSRMIKQMFYDESVVFGPVNGDGHRYGVDDLHGAHQPTGLRTYFGGSSEANADRTVFRETFNVLAINLIGNPSARCNLRISAQSSTANNSLLLSARKPRLIRRGSKFDTGSVFRRRRRRGPGPRPGPHRRDQALLKVVA